MAKDSPTDNAVMANSNKQNGVIIDAQFLMLYSIILIQSPATITQSILAFGKIF